MLVYVFTSDNLQPRRLKEAAHCVQLEFRMQGKIDWLRFILMVALAVYLVYRIKVSTEKLLEWRMGSTVVSMSAQELVLPSVTFCMESYGNRTVRSDNITADYEKLPGLDNMLLFVSQSGLNQNK